VPRIHKQASYEGYDVVQTHEECMSMGTTTRKVDSLESGWLDRDWTLDGGALGVNLSRVPLAHALTY